VQNKPRRDNPYQPPCFDDFPQLHHQPRDRRVPPLVVVHALYVLQEMKPFALLALMFMLNLISCGKGKSTDTASTAFTTVAERQEFLERYVKFRRSYEDVHFRISFTDGDSGLVAGPTEWNIRLTATVPADEIDQWIDGLGEVKLPDLEWIPDVPNAPTNLSDFKWYQDDKRTVGVNRVSRTVLYRNHAL
jgi:hypothetical protein